MPLTRIERHTILMRNRISTSALTNCATVPSHQSSRSKLFLEFQPMYSSGQCYNKNDEHNMIRSLIKVANDLKVMDKRDDANINAINTLSA